MFASVLISTYNWKEALALCVRSVFQQTVQPAEIVIADDGSRDDTREMIEQLRKETTIPIIHVWHEDKGFRKTKILNDAIRMVSQPYIIQIDGDVVLEKHFIADHLELAERGYFVCGSRVGVNPEQTKRFFESGGKYRPWFFNLSFMYMLNSFRFKPVRDYLEKRYFPKNIKRLRGCNMAFWKDDLLRVNGYNEALTMWGQEDTEIAYRLIFSGVKKKFLKAGGVEYHLYHKPASRANLAFHNQVLEDVIANRRSWCENGILKDKPCPEIIPLTEAEPLYDIRKKGFRTPKYGRVAVF